MSDPALRATDPGVRLFQLEGLKWVHCPRCDGPAREEGRRVTCTRCSFVEGGPKRKAKRLREVMLAKNSPVCERRECGAPIPNRGKPARNGAAGPLARVECPTCGHVGLYPATETEPWDVARAWARLRTFWRGYPLYLHREVAGHTLVVYNAAHLDMLEQWLGARLRERGPSPGLTMMARLPRWMKAASNREAVLKALADIREHAKKEGLFP